VPKNDNGRLPNVMKMACSYVERRLEQKSLPAEIPGVDTFEGEVMHTARFKQDIDLTDKDVILFGTGCGAAQTAPRLAKAPYHAKSVTQIMRFHPWVVPKHQLTRSDFLLMFSSLPTGLRLPSGCIY
jgi:cation diffusion facilitator CzcD-associated flavoprotein CzcO